MIQMKRMKKALLLQALVLGMGAQVAIAGVNVNVNVGVPVPEVVVAPPPPPAVPAYAPPVEIVVEPGVEFIYPAALGFYVAVGVPYDLFYLDNGYYLFRDGRWLRSASARGPWVVQRYRELPRSLRRHKIERIRECRTREYVVYNRDRDRYRGRHFRMDKEEWKEHRKEAKERRKEEQRFEKEQRKEEKRWEKEERKEEKWREKEARREEKRHEKEERREHRGRHDD